jgi:hypothetical protein
VALIRQDMASAPAAPESRAEDKSTSRARRAGVRHRDVQAGAEGAGARPPAGARRRDSRARRGRRGPRPAAGPGRPAGGVRPPAGVPSLLVVGLIGVGAILLIWILRSVFRSNRRRRAVPFTRRAPRPPTGPDDGPPRRSPAPPAMPRPDGPPRPATVPVPVRATVPARATRPGVVTGHRPLHSRAVAAGSSPVPSGDSAAPSWATSFTTSSAGPTRRLRRARARASRTRVKGSPPRARSHRATCRPPTAAKSHLPLTTTRMPAEAANGLTPPPSRPRPAAIGAEGPAAIGAARNPPPPNPPPMEETGAVATPAEVATGVVTRGRRRRRRWRLGVVETPVVGVMGRRRRG